MIEARESVSGLAYIVDYDENLWLSFDKESREHCFETWTKKAAPMGCPTVVLRLHPDEWFPAHGHEKPYIAEQRNVDGAQRPMFKAKTVCYVELTDAFAQASELEQLKARAAAREVGQKSGADRWEVWRLGSKLDVGFNTQAGRQGSK